LRTKEEDLEDEVVDAIGREKIWRLSECVYGVFFRKTYRGSG
jgi:hypothetical protein